MATLHVRKVIAKHMFTFVPGASVLLFLLLSNPSNAESIAKGKEKAQNCAMCHGANGIAQMPNAPNLAGQPAAYLAEQLKNYRAGKRSNEIMNVIAKPLTDQEIDELAAWYASIRIEVK
jgi:cytochrome c553